VSRATPALEIVLSLAGRTDMLVRRTCSVCFDDVDDDGCGAHPLARIATDAVADPQLDRDSVREIDDALTRSDRCTFGSVTTEWTIDIRREDDDRRARITHAWAWGRAMADVLVDDVVVGRIDVPLFYGSHASTRGEPGIGTSIEEEGGRVALTLTGRPDPLHTPDLAHELLPWASAPGSAPTEDGPVVVLDGTWIAGRYDDVDSAALALMQLQEPRYSGDRAHHLDAVVVDTRREADVAAHRTALVAAGLRITGGDDDDEATA
jgi:hypothetical protein